jgi:hypothetical protein
MNTTETELQSLQRVLARLQSSKSADLPALMEALLPKLVPLTNNDSLRSKALAVVSEALKRIKLEKCSIDVTNLVACINPSMLPYGANFAMTFADVAIDFNPTIPTNNGAKVAEGLLPGLDSFSAFSPQSNALCYYALVVYGDVLIQYWSTQVGDMKVGMHLPAREILGDFATDMSLLARPVLLSSEGQQSAVGSIQPGLSQSRLERFTSRKKQWTAEQLKAFKFKLINAIPSGLFLPKHAALLAVVLANDADVDVAAQATFKMNGVAVMLGLDKDSSAAGSVCEFLLSICAVDAPVSAGAATAVQPHKRSALRPVVRLAALKWLNKFVPTQLPSHGKQVVMSLFNATFSPSVAPVASLLAEEVAVIGAYCQLLETVLQHGSQAQFGEVVLLVTLCVKKILQSFAYSTSSFSSSEVHTVLRSSCYRLVELTAGQYLTVGQKEVTAWVDSAASAVTDPVVLADDPAASIDGTVPAPAAVSMAAPSPFLTQLSRATVQETDLLMLLFQLLYREHELRTESSILAIYRALNALREAFVFVRKTSTTVPSLVVNAAGKYFLVFSNEAVFYSHVQTGSGSGKESSIKLQDLLRRVRLNGSDVKMRLAALHWSRTLFHWDAFVLETMAGLAGIVRSCRL